MATNARPAAVVMNMFYTGLGIARSLGEHGVRVIGLTAQRPLYGNLTRYAKCVDCPDSRNDPERLRDFLIELSSTLGARAVIFPTRDHDVVFLDRFRAELEPYYILTIPNREALAVCLDKFETWRAAEQVSVPSPKCHIINSSEGLHAILPELTYPCVLKPVAAYHWRTGANWNLVGARKAIAVSSEAELLIEYDAVRQAQGRVLIQDLIPGADDCLKIAACYFNKQSRYVAGFNTRKLVQVPEGFGTGCIVQATDQPELLAPTVRLLESIGYTGIAEVEYKWHADRNEYQLIEINPRPWDQHRLGYAIGVDLIYLAYCDHTGMSVPAPFSNRLPVKWIAEDVFVMAFLRLLWGFDLPGLRSLLQLARGKRIYAISSLRDPIPGLVYLFTRFVPDLAGAAVAVCRHILRKVMRPRAHHAQGGVYETRFGKGNG
jgi:D-aspartate ligase